MGGERKTKKEEGGEGEVREMDKTMRKSKEENRRGERTNK